jgi:hypothetical protein
MRYNIIIEDENGNYIDAAGFWILKENDKNRRREIIESSFDRLKFQFIHNLELKVISEEIQTELNN